MIETVGVEFVGTHHRAAQAGVVSEQALYVVCASAAVIAVGGTTLCRPPPAETPARFVCSLDVRPSLMHSTERSRGDGGAASLVRR